MKKKYLFTLEMIFADHKGARRENFLFLPYNESSRGGFIVGIARNLRDRFTRKGIL